MLRESLVLVQHGNELLMSFPTHIIFCNYQWLFSACFSGNIRDDDDDDDGDDDERSGKEE